MGARIGTILKRSALGLVLLLTAATAAILIWLAAAMAWSISGSPTVERVQSFAPQDIERALGLLKTHDPRWQRNGIVRAVRAEERDLNLLLAHVAARWPGLLGQVELRNGQADLHLSIDLNRVLPRLGWSWPFPGRPWLNVRARFLHTATLPELDALSLGSMPTPSALATWLFEATVRHAGRGVDLQLLRDVVRHVELRGGWMLVFYAWHDDTGARLMHALTPPADQLRLRAYAEALASFSRGRQSAQPLSIVELLQPLFLLARERTGQGHDAAIENRAALLAATLYANRQGMSVVVPDARQWPKPRWWQVTLASRLDTPLHFLISASLAAESGSPLADAVGLYKELADSRGGTGFSFNDLAADRAGTRFGELAVREPKRLQDAVAIGLSEQDLLPDIADLPESMTTEQFEARYGGVGAPAYARMHAEIEQRLDSVPLLRPSRAIRP